MSNNNLQATSGSGLTLAPINETISLSHEEVKASWMFAHQVFATNAAMYARRSQNNPDIIKHQIATGKLGEFAVARYFQTRDGERTLLPDFKVVNAPDCQIYEKKQKTYGADLVLSNESHKYNVNVKTQAAAQAERFGLSWTFQHGRGGSDKAVFFGTEDELIVLVKLAQSGTSAELLWGLGTKYLRESSASLLTAPIRAALRDTKLVITDATCRALTQRN